MRRRCGKRERLFPVRKLREESLQLATIITEGCIQDLLQPCFARLGDQITSSIGQVSLTRACPLQNFHLRFGNQIARGLIVEHAKSGRNSCLNGKARKEILAERMDGLDFQSAGRLQRQCKEPPRTLQIFSIGD